MSVRCILFNLIFIFIFMMGCSPTPSSNDEKPSDKWTIGPFSKVDSLNPILEPDSQSLFHCPIRKEEIHWEARNVLNPASVYHEGKIYMLYRAQDSIGILSGTSRLGLAVSEDGLHFRKHPEPVFYPDNDDMKIYEWEGGVEDPRIVTAPDGSFIMTYTAWDGKTARLAIAQSTDLLHWKKQGLLLQGIYKDLWSKSGSIICTQAGEELVATKINGKYWMYWGDTNLYICTSEDLIHWKPYEDSTGHLRIFMRPRPGKFDSDLVEPGPPAVLGKSGIVLLYNGRNAGPDRDPALPEGTYASGQVLTSVSDPTRILSRTDSNFFRPDKSYEIHGEVGNVCFIEGLVPFKGKWFLYYGTADSRIGVAISDQ